MRGSRQLFKLPAKARPPLRLAAGVGLAALVWHASPKLLTGSSSSSSGEKIKTAFDGVVRSSRAIYTISFIVVDYKYSLRKLPPQTTEYRVKLSEVKPEAITWRNKRIPNYDKLNEIFDEELYKFYMIQAFKELH